MDGTEAKTDRNYRLIELLDNPWKWVPYKCHKYRPVISMIGYSTNAPRNEAHDDRKGTDQIRGDECSGNGFLFAFIDVC